MPTLPERASHRRLALLGGSPIRTAPFHAWPVFDERERQALLQVLESAAWGRAEGKAVERFERRFAEAHGAKHGISVCNGTVALRLALLALDIRAGDEVLVPPYTFLATATAVVECNAAPVFVDIEPRTYNLDPSRIEEAITPRTRAIIPVHFAGLPAEMDRILEIAHARNLKVIEDAAHAHGASYNGRQVGSLGDLGCFSFQSTKNMTSGEGGIVLTDDDGLADAVRSIHNCGREEHGPWYMHHRISGNYRLSEFQGAVLECQLDRLAEQTARRDENGRYLAGSLSALPFVECQHIPISCTRHAYHLFLWMLDEEKAGVPRAAFVKALQAEGIPASEGYPLPLYRQPLFVHRRFGPYTACADVRPDLEYTAAACPACERACASEGAWLPQSVLLGTKADMDDIATAFEKVCGNCGQLAEWARGER